MWYIFPQKAWISKKLNRLRRRWECVFPGMDLFLERGKAWCDRRNNILLRASDRAKVIEAIEIHHESEPENLSKSRINFVIELRSASDTLTGLKTKMQEYIENGISLGWLINRQNLTVHVYPPNQEIQILENIDPVSDDPELPGFSLLMAKIW